MQVVSLEKLNSMVGEALGTSDWFTIDQERIDQFADVTIDHQFIHVDEERAARTSLGGTIAHGFLTLSLTVHLTSQISVAPENTALFFNYGLDRLRFIHPVRAGSRVRAHTELLDVTERGPDRVLIKTGVTVEIEGEEKPALIAEMLTMAVSAG